jgi:putative Mn2+ efflux pump MntP
MSLSSIILIAIGLAMDAFAVSVSSGLAIRELKLRHALKIALFFGLFQAVMPVLGWLGGVSVRELIAHVDHWIAFGLLTFIGVKMIWESFRLEPEEDRRDPLGMGWLLTLSVATSIDALAVGITFALIDVTIVAPVIIIGAVTFVLSFAGVIIGDRVGHLFESRIEIAGGLVLIGIGVKILLEHLGVFA